MHNRRLDGRPGKGFFKQPPGRIQDINILVGYTETRWTKRQPKITLFGIVILIGYTRTREAKIRLRTTLFVPIFCINPSVKKRRLRRSSLIYESLKKKGIYKVEWRLGQRV
jgi:hypothetical protein